eukprot:TRINITY_DN11836_c0_g1_i1.p1 TRINITY_DN11836_c0_g1~~TRINITY_DN11836_c0_g1_i1.p1  ORF type:complete len:475 (-),score=43.32 TRINITY_DN11836_c0_g1_i1:53-1477(-)
MIDWVLTTVSGLMLMVIFAVNMYIVIYFQHPDDYNTSMFPKVICVLAFTFASINILMLPLDIASRNSTLGGLPMGYMWMSIYIIIAVFIVILIPFAIFYYQSYDPTSSTSPAASAAKVLIIVFILFAILTVIGYIFLGFAEIPVQHYTSNLTNGDSAPTSNCPEDVCSNSVSTTREIKISFILFMISMMTFLGWILFFFLGGIGLVTLPADLINGYIYRPRPIKKERYKQNTLTISRKTDQLLAEGVMFQSKKPKSKDKRRWKKNVHNLVEDFKTNEVAYKKKGGPVIVYWGKLALGIGSVCLTLVWIVHIILWPVANIYPFLNYFFLAMDGVLSFFGVVIFGIFSFYLLFCVIKGNFKFGIRVPFLYSFNPMKLHGTTTSAMLVNAGIVLLCSTAVVQFCTTSFDQYSRLTSIDTIFSLAIKNIRALKYVWLVDKFLLIGMALITFIIILWKPLDAEKDSILAAQRRARNKDH